MPILDTDRPSTPRSALRYRPAHPDEAGPVPGMKRRSRPDARASAAKVAQDDLEEEERLPRRPASLSAPRRGTALVAHVKRRFHPMFWLGVGALVLLLLWVGISQLVTWGGNTLNDLRYGYPRTFQMDAVISHHDDPAYPTHLLALNLHGEIILEEFPGGDVSQARSYLLTTLVGPGSDQAVVTLRLIDPLYTGKPDVIVTVGDLLIILVNDQSGFRPPTPSERQQLLPYLQS